MDSKEVKTGYKGIRIIGFTSLMLLLIYLFFKDTYVEIGLQLKTAALGGILLIALLGIAYVICDGILVAIFAKKHRSTYTYKEGILTVWYATFYKGITFGSGTKVAQMYMLNEQGIPLGISGSFLTLNYALHKLCVLLYMSLTISGWQQHLAHSYTGYIYFGYGLNLVIIGCLVLACTWKRFHELILWLLRKGLEAINKIELYEVVEAFLVDLEKESRTFFKAKGRLIICTLLNLIKLSCWYMIPYIAYWSMTREMPPIDFWEGMALASVMNLLVGVIPAPVGMGSSELVYLMLFSSLFGKLTTDSTMLLYRMASYYLPFLIGIGVVMMRRFNKIKEGEPCET